MVPYEVHFSLACRDISAPVLGQSVGSPQKGADSACGAENRGFSRRYSLHSAASQLPLFPLHGWNQLEDNAIWLVPRCGTAIAL
jgi:hypothetical protein